jgi:hypothetical protein
MLFSTKDGNITVTDKKLYIQYDKVSNGAFNLKNVDYIKYISSIKKKFLIAAVIFVLLAAAAFITGYVVKSFDIAGKPVDIKLIGMIAGGVLFFIGLCLLIAYIRSRTIHIDVCINTYVETINLARLSKEDVKNLIQNLYTAVDMQ